MNNLNPNGAKKGGIPPNYRTLKAWEQGGLNSCTACVFSDLISKVQRNQNKLSPLFLYYNARKLVGKVYLNCTLSFEDVLHAYQQYGICEDSYWSYEVKNFSRQPAIEAYDNAESFAPIEFSPIAHNLKELTDNLTLGTSIFAGIRFYRSNFTSFHKGEISKTAYLPIPEENESSIFNHAILLVAYNKENKTFIARNSFGQNWGNDGYFEIEQDYILDPERSFSLYRAHAIP
jgi:C1A family cysteine protease